MSAWQPRHYANAWAALATAALPAVALWRWRGSTTSAERMAHLAAAATPTGLTATAGCSRATVSAGATDAERLSSPLTDGPAPRARCADIGTPDAALDLVEGIKEVLAAEFTEATARGNDREAYVLMHLFADCIDATDALEAP